MASDPTNAGNYTLQQNNIAGFAEAFLLELFGLSNCGLVQVRTDARYGTGNVWQVRGRIRDLTALQTPTAATDLDVNDISQYTENGVVVRRAQVYGIEDIAKLAAADPNALNDYGRLLEHNIRYGINTLLHDSMLPALFDETNGCLAGTHYVNTQGAAFESVRIQQALRVWGEHGTMADGVLMHSYVRSKLYEQGLILPGDPDLVRELETRGVRYGGTLSGAPIFIDDMCAASNSGGPGTYNTYVFKRGAMLLGYNGQLFDVKIWRDELLAGGTDLIKALTSFSPHVYGVTTSLAPTAGGGATDAEIALATNWTKRASVTSPEIGIVCIKSTEV